MAERRRDEVWRALCLVSGVAFVVDGEMQIIPARDVGHSVLTCTSASLQESGQLYGRAAPQEAQIIKVFVWRKQERALAAAKSF